MAYVLGGGVSWSRHVPGHLVYGLSSFTGRTVLPRVPKRHSLLRRAQYPLPAGSYVVNSNRSIGLAKPR